MRCSFPYTASAARARLHTRYPPFRRRHRPHHLKFRRGNGSWFGIHRAASVRPSSNRSDMSTEFGKVLVVDDDEDVLQAARLLLKKRSALVHTERDPEQLPVLLRNHDYDVILLDMNFRQAVSTGREGFFWLDKKIGRASCRGRVSGAARAVS